MSGKGGRSLRYGVGINDAGYSTLRCPVFSRWNNMLKRCYNLPYIYTHPSYKDCSVCDEWLIFSNFKVWMEQQDWEGKHLDKDLLVRGNKIYSPDTCVFVDHEVNYFIRDCGDSKGTYKTGVHFNTERKRFVAQIRQGKGKRKTLGYFCTEADAHKVWLKEKIRVGESLAFEQTDERIKTALFARIDDLIAKQEI